MPDWIQLTADVYKASTSYIDANYRKQWDNNLRLFQSRHGTDSKYNSEAYRHRSKLFRPKTRSVIRKIEAAAAAAFFSNMDVVDVAAESPQHEPSAAIQKELLNYRLQKTIPWFLTLIGGIQDAAVMGAVCSYQYWKYKATKDRVLADEPCIELWPIENIRIDPAADWRDPVTSSPYLQRIIPMYVCDVEEMMTNVDDKTGQPKWKRLSRDEIAATTVDFDSTRQSRLIGRVDPFTESRTALKEFDLVWVIENFVRWEGEDRVWYTMGTKHMLTNPVPIEEVYWTGDRPIVMGIGAIEAHKVYPSSLAELGQDLQREANEIVNQRLDNVKLVLNKRWIVKRGKNVDTGSLNRNVPGGVTMAEDPEGDIKEVNWPDVTNSAFEEQNRVNVDFDDLLGAFSSGSVSTNRQLNETVGGMALLSQGANALTEYSLRTVIETWVERVLRQLVKLEAKYETDVVVLGVAAEKAQLLERYGVSDITDELLNQDLTVTVNVGMNATDPMQRFQKFMTGVGGYAQLSGGPQGLNLEEVGQEMFSILGYKDASRFLSDQNPQAQALQAQLQEMGQQLQQLGQENQQLKAQNAQIKADSAKKAQADHLRLVSESAKSMVKDQQLQSKGVQDRAQIMKTIAETDLIEAQTELTIEQTKVVPDMALQKAAAEKGD